MDDEKKFADEILSDEELDNVAGGTGIETFNDGEELSRRGLLSVEGAFKPDSVRNCMHELGYTGYKDNGSLDKANVYTDKSGNVITREQFWKNFDADYSRTMQKRFPLPPWLRG